METLKNSVENAPPHSKLSRPGARELGSGHATSSAIAGGALMLWHFQASSHMSRLAFFGFRESTQAKRRGRPRWSNWGTLKWSSYKNVGGALTASAPPPQLLQGKWLITSTTNALLDGSDFQGRADTEVHVACDCISMRYPEQGNTE